MASFFSGLLASLKVTFFAPSRSEVPSSVEVQNNGMPSFGLPSMDESVNEHSKIEKIEDETNESAVSSRENGDLAQSVDQPTSEVSSGHASPSSDGQCTSSEIIDSEKTVDQLQSNVTDSGKVIDPLQSEVSGSEKTSDQHQSEVIDPEKVIGQRSEVVDSEIIDQLHLKFTDSELSDFLQSEVVDSEKVFDQLQSEESNREISPVASEESLPPATTADEQLEEDAALETSIAEEASEVPSAADAINDEKLEEPLDEILASSLHATHDTNLTTELEPDTELEEDIIASATTEPVSDNHGDQPTNVTENTGSEPVPLLLDDTGPLIEEYGSPMVVDEQDEPNTCQSLNDQPPLPPPSFKLTSPVSSTEHEVIMQSPAMTSEQGSFVSAKSNFLLDDFNVSSEPMEVDSISDVTTTIVEAHSDTSAIGSAENEFPDEDIPQPQNNMSAEESETAVAPTPAPPPALGNLTAEERPLCGKSNYVIDWDKFDENAVPNPFGGRVEPGVRKTPVKRPVKKQPRADEKKKVEPTDPDGGAAPAADNNANEVKPIEKSANVQEGLAVAAEKTEEDVKNSNVVQGETSVDPQPASQNKENVSARNTPNKAVRPSPQQTAVVAPTVHVAAVGSGNEVDNASAAPRNALRRPPIKTKASVNASVQQTVPMPAQNNRHSSPKGARSGDESISEEEMFVMASSDPFNDSAAFEYLQQAGGGASRGSADVNNLHRQSLYQKFDPLLGGDGAVASGSETKQRQKQPPAPGSTDGVISVGDITFTEKDDLLLTNTPSPVRNQSRSDEPLAAPSTVVKKKHGPKIQSGAADSLAQGDASEADRLLSVIPDQKTQSPAASASGQEVKLQFQALLMAKEKEFMLRLEEEKLKRMQLEMELGAVKKEAEAAKQNSAEMSFVVAEYEKTVRQLIAEKDKPKQNRFSGEYELVQKERDQALEDLQTVENAFSELNRRYETLRNSGAEFKKNEELLKSSLADYQHKLKKSEEKFNKLYAHAEHKLELANQEIERLQKAKETDTLALRAALKKRDLQVETLEKNLEQKQKEIQELTAICDELIQKAGGH